MADDAAAGQQQQQREQPQPPLDLQHCLQVAREAALAAGDLIKRAAAAAAAAAADGSGGTGHQVILEHKASHADLVTATDRACEDAVRARLQAAFPTHRFIGEEGSAAAAHGADALTDAPTWCVDPLDGTTNFVHGYPFSCVSIGLAVGRAPVVGVVYAPLLGELFEAARGRGATLNGRPIRVSATAELRAALCATEIGVARSPETLAALLDRFGALVASTRSVRCCGSCALNLAGVACGRLDAFYEVGFGGCWDVAAAACILLEAGGELLDPSGGRFDLEARRVLGSNGRVGAALAAVLARCKVSREEPPAPGPLAAEAAAAAEAAGEAAGEA